MIQNPATLVGLGELKVLQGPSGVLACVGLGSCVGVSAFDPVKKVGGMAHVVLPAGKGRPDGGSPKYADAAIEVLVEEMVKRGASKSRLVIKIVGGAQVIPTIRASGLLKIGEDNVIGVKQALTQHGLRLAGAETGGNSGRSIRLALDSGTVLVSTANGTSKEL